MHESSTIAVTRKKRSGIRGKVVELTGLPDNRVVILTENSRPARWCKVRRQLARSKRATSGVEYETEATRVSQTSQIGAILRASN